MSKNEIIFKNIKSKLKEEGKQLGEFEKEIGVSIGYFSRIVKKRSAFSLDILLNVLNKLNMTFEELITYTARELSLTPLEAIEFIEQALKGTIKKETKVKIYKCIEIIKKELIERKVNND